LWGEKLRKEFEMTEEELNELLEACKPVPYMLVTGGREMFESPQAKANRVWKRLGEKYGFIWDSCKPCGKGQRIFTAEVIPSNGSIEIKA